MFRESTFFKGEKETNSEQLSVDDAFYMTVLNLDRMDSSVSAALCQGASQRPLNSFGETSFVFELRLILRTIESILNA
jgi:hypothetical protein